MARPPAFHAMEEATAVTWHPIFNASPVRLGDIAGRVVLAKWPFRPLELFSSHHTQVLGEERGVQEQKVSILSSHVPELTCWTSQGFMLSMWRHSLMHTQMSSSRATQLKSLARARFGDVTTLHVGDGVGDTLEHLAT